MSERVKRARVATRAHVESVVGPYVFSDDEKLLSMILTALSRGDPTEMAMLLAVLRDHFERRVVRKFQDAYAASGVTPPGVPGVNIGVKTAVALRRAEKKER